MHIEPLPIRGAWVVTPRLHEDDRGVFLEWFKGSSFGAAVGRSFDLAQMNCSVSARGVVRGIHYADVPPGQAKYVTCVSGSVLDVIIDLREGSETFGEWTSVRLDGALRRCVYLAEGLGHAFCALEDGSTVVYMCTTEFDPAREHSINPRDPRLGIAWPLEPIVLSPRDSEAPNLSELEGSGALPRWEACFESGGRATRST